MVEVNHISKKFSANYLGPVADSVGVNQVFLAEKGSGAIVIKKIEDRQTGIAEINALKSWRGLKGLAQLDLALEIGGDIYISTEFIEGSPLWPDQGDLGKVADLLEKINKVRPTNKTLSFKEALDLKIDNVISSRRREIVFKNAEIIDQGKIDSFLHFDFYSGNVLETNEGSLSAIDPVGAKGPAIFDICFYGSFTTNPAETIKSLIEKVSPDLTYLDQAFLIATTRQAHILETYPDYDYLSRELIYLSEMSLAGKSAREILRLS